ncbi:NAD(P)/FAD-dependent oxidoreductase [Nakamurella alba]|uniref:NAD(P)/FAD-dependent oxidoreductase n=1 Tax=Nakamurella alba TaxID=2665158 RepID=UPI002AC33231|nr:NAD(P)/FAD-dependent oxidoreductase [Nakamurella alba]
MTGYDVVVIGGGSAGLSGAVALARSRRSVLVVDSGDPRNRPAAGVHGYLGREDASPTDLLASGRAELESYGGVVRSGTVTSAHRADDAGFVVEIDGSAPVRARRILLTTGLVDELPEVPGLREHWGSDVVHCPYCHGWEVRDLPIGVLATGPMAVHQALMFRQLSADVVLLTHEQPLPPAEELAKLAAMNVPVIEGRVAALLDGPDGALAGVRMADGRELSRRVVAVASRMVARSAVADGLGLVAEPHPMGGWIGMQIPVDPMGRTSVPGVFAAGNVTDLQAQVVVAAGQGLKAGAMINADLIEEDVAAAAQRVAERTAV